MTTSRRPQHNATHYVDTPGPLLSSGDTQVPPDTGPDRLTTWPPGGTDDHSHELDHLIHMIDDVFGFARIESV
jgi:hypothetical protein